MERKAESRGKGCILLVERDAEARAFVSSALIAAGYQVIEAADGHTAFALSESIIHPVHLLLTDAALNEELNGVDLARHLLVMRRGLQVLYLSAIPSDAGLRRQMQEAFDSFLAKPIEEDSLLAKVRTLMEKGRAGSGKAGPSGCHAFTRPSKRAVLL